jgi:isoprenylcysteine carboxyl methyltransferase (ICMT) family protein YpbQ
VVKTFLLVILAVASILIVIVSVGVFLFSAATSAGTEQDQIEGMKVAGVCLLLASSITLGWIIYGLRGAWRVVSAVPFALLLCLGLLWISPV